MGRCQCSAAEATTDLYVGSGKRGDDLSVDGRRVNPKTSGTWTTVWQEAAVVGASDARAQFQVTCTPTDELDLSVWWYGVPDLNGEVTYQIGELQAVDARWLTGSGSGGPWLYHQAPDPAGIARAFSWAARSGGELSFSFELYGRTYSTTFDLEAIFNTPAQPNLTQCGSLAEPPRSVNRSRGLVGTVRISGGARSCTPRRTRCLPPWSARRQSRERMPRSRASGSYVCTTTRWL